LKFHVGQLRTLAGIHAVGHHLLATTRERFRLRVAVLRYGLRAAVGMLLRNSRGLVSRPETISEWDRLTMIRADVGTLTDESLESLRVLLASLTAVRREPGRRTAGQESRG
jgi:hypothetical protein